jgi:orotate phosphoribosyltransferase
MPLRNDDSRSQLLDLLAARSVRRGRFTLASGAVSDVYIDGKLTTLGCPEAMPLVGRVFLQKLQECGWTPDAVGGLTLGADPIALMVARESIETQHAIRAFIVRKQPKQHGTKRFIEGLERTDGLQVVVVDDVCTKGGSTGEAILKAREAGLHVIGAICLVDREEGATAYLADSFQCRLESIFKLSEVLARHDESNIAKDRPVGAHT